jgi:two-component system response regulator
MEILLIDDNTSDVMMFRRALNAVGSESKLTICEDGNKAMDYLLKAESDLNAVRPDLIILDLNLPGISGLQLLKFLKTDKILTRIPVIILTDSDSAQDITDAYNLFANCFIIKPRDSDLFMKYVEYIDNFWSTTVSISND